ncbi:hypothetical protein Fmac_016723 [Flemingia macrophylla]|uniref:Uncharacterized protein n=1 Tax=Flemingia macrophylla TaxID=520843 RepID=A0ABD1MKD7_9FABA
MPRGEQGPLWRALSFRVWAAAKNLGGELAMGSHHDGHSKEFLDLIKSIGEARSKEKEDRIVLREIKTLKRRINDVEIPNRKMKEYIIHLLYVEMLGHDASVDNIHVVKMTHHHSLLLKRTVLPHVVDLLVLVSSVLAFYHRFLHLFLWFSFSCLLILLFCLRVLRVVKNGAVDSGSNSEDQVFDVRSLYDALDQGSLNCVHCMLHPRVENLDCKLLR